MEELPQRALRKSIEVRENNKKRETEKILELWWRIKPK
jgi:hypothetical protein